MLHCSGTTPDANIRLKSLVNRAVVCLGDFFLEIHLKSGQFRDFGYF